LYHSFTVMDTRKNIKTVVFSIFSGYSFRKRVTAEPGVTCE